ncbi:MAG: hypothetical protein U0Q18_06340 [Bryobacteraceae bacterium]
MIRFLFLRIILPLVIFWLIRGVLKSIFASLNSSVAQRPEHPSQAPAGGELKKDPVCGTFVSVDASVTKKINGQTLHFCSPACRDKYVAA